VGIARWVVGLGNAHQMFPQITLEGPAGPASSAHRRRPVFLFGMLGDASFFQPGAAPNRANGGRVGLLATPYSVGNAP